MILEENSRIQQKKGSVPDFGVAYIISWFWGGGATRKKSNYIFKKNEQLYSFIYFLAITIMNQGKSDFENARP
jgi:hypothetical protein